ncbi:single-stranded-DNA-specific exonuclease RecJ [Methanobacterium paludis]|uniref:Phosphoesterase DHHA1 n=1 Tax=Methanobacterium paludis (strain DSM 25820 / JCM 18151 / SWAN1) TaxID=868131 RepID=F6D4P5_METPW|nr:single-stranded-DNA-specific exonuclease RecJ [Methanobacterium paludis]AEG17530.1 phosphoesterase DHHA1 [Methanobacterium paludis]
MVESQENPMNKALSKAHEMVEKAEDIKIYSHIDCDGITAGSLLSLMLDRLGKEHEIEFISLDKIDDLKTTNELTIFSDLGSGQNLDKFCTSSSKVLVLDHHPPLREMNHYKKCEFLEINPHFYNMDGSYEISGGGMTYLLAKTFGFYDLSWMGVLSAVGDMQNSLTGKLQGLNQDILTDSVQNNFVESINDLSIYGRQTRPLFVALSYFGDVNLPITNNKTECILMLNKLGIPTKNGRKNRSLCDLSVEEKSTLFSELVRMLSREVPPKYVRYIPKLICGDSYEFLNEKKYSPLRDASEFSTAVNACSRHEHPEIAMRVLKGDRALALDDMDDLAREHKRYLAQKMDWVREEERIIPMNNIQYFNGSEIKSNVIGTIAGMILSYGDWKKPIIGFTEIGDGKDGLKVSLRCSRLLAYNGVHFGNLIRKVAEKVGGTGGGHSVACGAYIPEGSTEAFLNIFDESLNGMI